MISLLPFLCSAQERRPIIDMHLHAYSLDVFSGLISPPPILHCVPMTSNPIPEPSIPWREIIQNPGYPCEAIWSPMNDEVLINRTLKLLDKYTIVAAVTSGPLTCRWEESSPERIIPALFYSPVPGSPPVDSLRSWYLRGEFKVLGEITPQYDGISAVSPEMEPVWALAEELNFPVNIPIGSGPVGAHYMVWPNYRASLHRPLQMETALQRHPDIRVYLGHAAWPMIDELLAVMWTHPQLYVDISVINWALPRAEFDRYLKRIVESGFGKRVLFDSDQMVWPGAIGIAIEAIETAGFLTDEQKAISSTTMQQGSWGSVMKKLQNIKKYSVFS